MPAWKRAMKVDPEHETPYLCSCYTDSQMAHVVECRPPDIQIDRITTPIDFVMFNCVAII